MNWQRFQTYNEASTRAFEAMCNQLFELWINRTYVDEKKSFVVVNGAGGDGGVEAYATLVDGSEVGVQAKWFLDSINASQFSQIKRSILTALTTHTKLVKYIVCVPRDLSNIKIGKNGKAVKDTEYSKWEKCVADIKAKYPNVDVLFWGDHKITEQLQCADAAGVRRYWFEREELTQEIIKYSFEKQKDGWLAQRYIPVLHNRGMIHAKIRSFLGNQQDCDEMLNNIDSIEKKYQTFCRESASLCEVLEGKEHYKEAISNLQEISRRVLLQREELLLIYDAYKCENKLPGWQDFVLSDGMVYEMKEWVEKHSFGDFSNHFWKVRKALEAVCEIDFPQLYENLRQRSAYGKILIVGAQGTGKTHGIAYEVETLLEEGYTTPILVQAKSVSNKDEWKDILIRTLGLSQVWGEDELWAALEAISYRVEANHPVVDKSARIIPKVLICIDGIDELKPYSRWHERINQVNAITARHPRIRFCFTGRRYAFNREALVEKQEYKVVYLSDDGDIPVKKIYNDYVRFYGVNDEGAKWLKYSISTPYALKLLCEIYQGSIIQKIGKSDVTVTQLLKKKFTALDKEFKTSIGVDESVQIPIIKTVLIKLDDIFQGKQEVTCTEIKEVLRQHTVFRYLNETGLDQVLDFLEKQSFLQSYQRYGESIFDEEERIYSLGVQPVYDYLKALRLYERENYTDDMVIDYSFLENTSVMQMYSVMILEHFGKILWNNKSCREYLREEDLFQIVAFALANVDVEFSSKYRDWIAAVMRKNAFALGYVVNYITLPLARYEGHPLGSMLLDECLKQFDKPAERDLIWSVPTGLKYSDNAIWVRYEDINYGNENYKLEADDKFDGMPLVWAWGLTSVDNQQRTMVRQELTQWGIAQPEEFYKLFLHFCKVNDPQVSSDIFSIAMAIAHVCRKNHIFLRRLTQWLSQNIFQYGKIVNIRNASIRYYARAIMECAYAEKIVTDTQIEKCRPPYRMNNSLLPFAVEATQGSLMSGYKTLDYDLARYVLGDPINRMFLNNRNYRDEINKLLKKYSKNYNITDMTGEKFILGTAFGYVKQAGWTEEIFYGKPKGGKAGERVGADIAIERVYWHATHGSMSSIMSITEKYAWCAKMEILGYLADRLPFYDYQDDNYYVYDYGLLEDYVNPYQELCHVDLEKVMAETEWLLPEDLAPSIKECSFNEAGIRKWLQVSPIPDFSKWIQAKEGKVALCASHIISNEAQGVSTILWISSGLIQKGHVNNLLSALNDEGIVHELFNPVDFLAYPDTDCYLTPLEVCWFDWKEENSSEILYGNHALYKNMVRCVCDIQGKGENYFDVPSKIVRKLLGIVSGDGYHYYDDEGKEIAFCTNAGEQYGDSQSMLLVDKKVYKKKVAEAKLQPIWIVRVLKEVSTKAGEKFKFFADRDETYLVWRSNRQWKHELFNSARN